MPLINAIQKQTFTRKEAAAYLGIAENSLRKFLDSGEIPYKKFGRRLIIPKTGVDNFLSEIMDGGRVAK